MKELKAFILIIILFVGCATNPVTHKKELSLLSVSGEKRIGRQVVLTVSKEDLSQGPFITSGFAVDYLQSIIDRFMPYYERRGEIPVAVEISPTAVPNAWAVPGYITVNLGLIPCLEDEAQLAFVLGHELGHIAARHTAERYTQSLLLSLGLKGVSLYGGNIAGLVGNVAASLYIASYSRSQERMADELGFKYMSLSGYDPEDAYKAMESIERCGNEYMKFLGIKKVSGIAGFLERLFADHPSTKERIARLQAKLKALKVSEGVKGYGDFSRLRSWALERKALLIKLDKAYFLLKRRKKKEARKNIEEVVDSVKRGDFEPEIKAKVYSFSGYLYLLDKNYERAWTLALRAIMEKPDYYVSYKIAGIAGLRDDTYRGLKVAQEAFSDCLERKASDPDYIAFFGRAPVDGVCLKGAIISSCKLGYRKMCRAYCRSFYRHYKGFPPDLIRYCLF